MASHYSHALWRSSIFHSRWPQWKRSDEFITVLFRKLDKFLILFYFSRWNETMANYYVDTFVLLIELKWTIMGCVICISRIEDDGWDNKLSTYLLKGLLKAQQLTFVICRTVLSICTHFTKEALNWCCQSFGRFEPMRWNKYLII